MGDDSLKRHYSSPGKMISTTVTDAKPEIHTAEVSTEKIAGNVSFQACITSLCETASLLWGIKSLEIIIISINLLNH